ncbi:MAG TPA: CGNR zinc finger domain-containing protein, partial [Mycobacterium sp.]|nr:CGNR zinc finger domain-containing protein [Mycobacterium sp.]
LSWCELVGLFTSKPRLTGDAARNLVPEVHEVREHAWAVFDAVARGESAPPGHLGHLLERAGGGVRSGHIRQIDTTLDEFTAKWSAPGAIPAALALVAVHAFFTLPPDRIRTCDRCGWLFLDSSRGGRRRWCSMSTCGNREKASRHRGVVS